MTPNNMKGAIVAHMLYTALRNGKDTDISKMTDLADSLRATEKKMAKLAVAQCNGDPSFSEEKWRELETSVKDMVEEKIGCKCYCDADPRGSVIRLYLVDEGGTAWYTQAETETTCLSWD